MADRFTRIERSGEMFASRCLTCGLDLVAETPDLLDWIASDHDERHHAQAVGLFNRAFRQAYGEELSE